MRWISNFVWGRYYIEIVRDALLQGGGWPATWYKVLIIARHRRDFLRIGVAHDAAHAGEGIAMKRFLQRIFNYRVRALIRKEFRQIRRDRRLAISLILPPTLQLLLFGFALSATVTNIRLGVVDDSRTPESRELIATPDREQELSARRATTFRSTSSATPSAAANSMPAS